MKDDELIDDFTGKISGLVSKANGLGTTFEEGQMVRKLLDSMPRSFIQIVASIEQWSDDLFGEDGAVFEGEEVDGVIVGETMDSTNNQRYVVVDSMMPIRRKRRLRKRRLGKKCANDVVDRSYGAFCLLVLEGGIWTRKSKMQAIVIAKLFRWIRTQRVECPRLLRPWVLIPWMVLRMWYMWGGLRRPQLIGVPIGIVLCRCIWRALTTSTSGSTRPRAHPQPMPRPRSVKV
ncbi:hypothetical protein E3N88_09460 [Mikania micrantha]|uniref:Uncharacterized protein n=1 Tax=Mikania micrantha TaxID=192012 RepID=A0A5N6PJ67_9ASTR|nr:hypothetical protein E3N88_09460 [Mikania micrantha]